MSQSRIVAIILLLIAAPVGAQNNNNNNNQNNMPAYNPYAPAPISVYRTYPGMVPYQNQPGFGYTANPYAQGYASYGMPVPVGGSNFRFNVGGFNGSYWRSPSGYYYPWGPGYGYGNVVPPVVVVQQGASAPAQPSINEMMKDMGTYIQDQNKAGKFNPDDYAHLNRRLNDLKVKQSMYASRNGGTLDSLDEETLRKDLSMLSGDIGRRVKP